MIPLSCTFANPASANHVLDGGTKVELIQNSPIFNGAGDTGKPADKTASAPPGAPVSAAGYSTYLNNFADVAHGC